MRRIWHCLPMALSFASVIPFSPARAACSTCGCTMGTAGLAFGTYNPQAPTPTDSVGTVSVACTWDAPTGTTATITVSPGSGGSIARRAMSGPGGLLLYNLYLTASRSTVWGDGSGGGIGLVVPLLGTGAINRTVSLYGRIPARQLVTPGPYADVIVVTISY